MNEHKTDDAGTSLYTAAFVASLLTLLIIPAQIVVFALNPLPSRPEEWLTLFAERPLVALFHADFFLLINNVLIAIIYIAFYHLLKDTGRGPLQIALVLGFIGIAAYVSSNKTFELMNLSADYAASSDAAGRDLILAATTAVLAGWQGTAFDVYYVLNAITLLVIAGRMFRSSRIGKTAAAFGLAAGILMCVPSTAGTVGFVFSLLSLVPWYVFTVMYARVFWKKSRDGGRVAGV